MSEEIDLYASNLSATEDAFEKFQSVAMFEEEDYITLSDIVPPVPSISNHCEELNAIPYDNEVVLGSPPNNALDQVNNQDTGHLDISEKNAFSEDRLDTSGNGYQNNASPRDLTFFNSSLEHLGCQKRYEHQNLLSDGLGTKNYVNDNSASIIQDSVLSTTVGQNIVPFQTPSDVEVGSNIPRRTKRGRIPNTARYPTTSATSASDLNKNTPVKRRPGRPRKVPLDQTMLEPDSTNIDITLQSENGSVIEDSTPAAKKGTQGKSKGPFSKVITPTPSKRGRKSTKVNTTKRKKGGPKRWKKVLKHSEPDSELVINNLGDDADDVCLSIIKNDLKEIEIIPSVEAKHVGDIQNDKEDKQIDDIQIHTETTPIDNTNSKANVGVLKRNSKMSLMSDFEYNIDKVVKQADVQPDISGESLLVEDTSKRRRTVKKSFVYDEGSDEDPFANVESSDDEPKYRKKGNKYNSDDEYVPRGDSSKKRRKIRSSSSDPSSDEDDLETKNSKTVFGVSPFKKGRKRAEDKSLVSSIAPKPFDKSLVSTIKPKAEDGDIEGCLETTMIKVDEALKPPAEAWATSNEFENFITKKIQGTSLKIKKVSSKENMDTLAPLDIPVVNQTKQKKTVETFTQTMKVSTSSISVQTSAPYDIPMKVTKDLTAAQSEKACEFLSSVVKTTVELGQLMSQKSDDFMKKKINTEHVTDTVKMDYCVRKSFLLFKLAKHNLMQMEEDLAKQYDSFLKEHNLSSCREIPKKITPIAKVDSDSDCEIVEVVGVSDLGIKKQNKPSKINPKTVFLNKELSIKIAKKQSTPDEPVPGKKKLELKGRHAVWINKNVMVTKVTPTQSFLAQDSRNKKPPDNRVTEKMVSDFFDGYNRQRALLTCRLLINTDWTCVRREYACNYFVNELDSNTVRNDLSSVATENNVETSDNNCNFDKINNSENPKTLFSLCTEVILRCVHIKSNRESATQKLTYNVTDELDTKRPVALFRLCINALRTNQDNIIDQYKTHKDNDNEKNYNLLDLHDQSNSGTIEDMREETNVWLDQYYIQDKKGNNSQCDTTCQYKKQGTKESDSFTQKDVLFLTSICYKKIVKILYDTKMNKKQRTKKSDSFTQKDVLLLTSICYKKIVKMFYDTKMYQETFANSLPKHVLKDNNSLIDGYQIHREEYKMYPNNKEDKDLSLSEYDSPINGSFVSLTHTPESLFSICVELIQRLQGIPKTPIQSCRMSYLNICKPKPLKSLAFETIKHILYNNFQEIDSTESTVVTEINNDPETNEAFTINCVNTLSEEAFESLQLPLRVRIRKQSQNSNFSGGSDDNDYGVHDEINFNADHEDDNGWASQLQMHEFRSCFTPHINTIENIEGENNETFHEPNEPTLFHEPNEGTLQIKTEPVDYFTEENIIDTSIVKTEPLQALQALNDMTDIPDSIITKKEIMDVRISTSGSPQMQSYNVETFEQFVKSNKMIQFMDDTNFDNDDNEIFSQSGLRIRRQHEPDVDPVYDMSMSLLVPHTFEPLQLVEAKGCLMETSSDDDSNSKKTGKKKDKRKKKNKKEPKTSHKETPIVGKVVPIVKDKSLPESEVAMLTRRMKEKLRQEEKKIESSESESDSLCLLSIKKDKNKKDKSVQKKENNAKSSSDTDTLYNLNSTNDDKIDNDIKLPKNKHPNAEYSKENKMDEQVQCNNVDSTEKLNDHLNNKVDEKEQFPGFTAIDRREMTNYQKIMHYVYNKIIPLDKNEQDNGTEETNNTSPIIHPDEPVELLECEPAMPMFDDDPVERQWPMKTMSKIKKKTGKDKPNFTVRHGWHCYSVDSNDTKLYKNAQIVLEKLPESFVETYMQYQDVMNKDLDDQEVDRLTNLQSLNRSITVKHNKDGKLKSRTKDVSKDSLVSGQNILNNSRSPSPSYSDGFDELVPSEEDEEVKVQDEIPPPMPARSSENNLAKNLLMDDHDSDSDGTRMKKIKEEPKDPADQEKIRRPEPKSQTKAICVDSDTLMLTADKMMNKELTLLHAPVVLPDGDIKDSIKKEALFKDESKSSKRITARPSKERVKNDDDSSSEEEKQWVSTKEKLLKRMGKKEDAIADDAKRAKLVNEFIERRNESDRKNKRESLLGRKGRARRKLLERQKQLRFLSNELYNDDGVTTGKRSAAGGLFKGRRNIRKVIDKKSLARSTVVANMEEFERKRRLNLRQNRLREVLGCEDGVNVLVINDEVCLEYDFQEQRPVVTVHQFFTKVMKAHQYEGVKFMWDACFESLGTIEAGHPGGGCILAHCMGLGKTLQVLALLHTVLTHPRANMHRVLVCCPLSTVLNWVDEIHKWIGPVTREIKVFELSKLRKTYERAYQLEDWYNGGGIFIIGYELFRSLTTLDPEIDEIRPTIINKIRTALLDPGPDIIVCDEGHLLKNDCSVLAVAMSRVVTKRRIVLTGTPMQNNLREYFCMVNFIKPNLLGTYSEYSNRFENPIMNGQHRDSREEDIKLMKARTHILHKVLEGCLQRQEASVLYPYLPKKHEYTVFIPLTQCQWDLYNHYMDNYARTQKQKQILKDFHILQKIWSHPQVLHNFQMKARDKKDKIKAEKIEDDLAIADQEADMKPAETEVWWLQYLGEGDMLDSLDSSNKFVAVFRILHECVALGDKILIFSTSLFSLDALEYFLKKINKWSLGQEYYRLDGSVPAEVRQKWCREFNAENNVKTQLFLISTRAGCLGLNMTAANRVIILDTSWNPAHDIQSIFRVYRFGQKKDCYIYRLVALGTMEQKIYERSVTKQAVACRVVDEQQIDRHYNLAELTELYSVDEMGLSVAGGVAVGVGDVALLRVARDAAIHAVHEHDSLLRGSGEQGLPEHERAAAWNQFQQEHEHKQMQNDLNANKALKRLEMEHLRQQALYSSQSYIPPNPVIKTENTAENYPLLQPKEETGQKPRGRKAKAVKVVQCRIPIASDPQPGPSTPPDDYENQKDMVQKITNLLIKHNFMQNKSGQREISELVAKVKKMVATGQPVALGPGYDELSSSIASVLLQRKEIPIPGLTDIERPPTISIPEAETRKSGKRKKATIEPPPAPPIPTPEPDGRRRRKAALVAEMQFDSQKEIIDLDDDGDEWQNDDAEIIDTPIEPTPPRPVKEKKPVRSRPQEEKSSKAKENSIVVSDDDVEVQVATPTPVPNTTNTDDEVVALHPSLLTNSNFIKIVAHTYLAGNPMMDEDAATLAAQYSTLKTLKEAESEGKLIESGPVYDIAIQVLGKDVLRKLQAANPQTSGESSLATNKLQSLLGGKSKESETPTPAPSTSVKKPRIGPKSKVIKDVKQERVEPQTNSSPKMQRKVNQPPSRLVPLSKAALFPPTSLSIPTPNPPALREESILPDDEDVVISEPTRQPAVDRKPILLRKVKIDRGSIIKIASAMPVSMGRGPAPLAPPPADQTPPTTICLDSDDEDVPILTPLPPHTKQMPTTAPTLQSAPVPVALMGPNVRPISMNQPVTSSTLQPAYFTLSSCGTRAIPIVGSIIGPKGTSQPVPVSLMGPNQARPFDHQQPMGTPQPVSLMGPNQAISFDHPQPVGPMGTSQPVPVSLRGPSQTRPFDHQQPTGTPQPVPVSLLGPSQTRSFDHQPVPVSFTGPNGKQVISGYVNAGRSSFVVSRTGQTGQQGVSYSGHGRSVPSSLAGAASQPVPMSLVGPNSQPIPMSLSGPGGNPSTMAFGATTTQPIPMSLVDSSGRPVTFSVAPQRSQTGNLTLRPAIHVIRQSSPDAISTPAHAPRFQNPNANAPPLKTLPKPSDELNVPKSTYIVDILNRKLGRTKETITHTIVDDEPTLMPSPEVAKPAEVVAKAPPARIEAVPLPSRSTSPYRSKKGTLRRSGRRASYTSSSSSERSRSSSPDPLAILKDVVHIQAPEKIRNGPPNSWAGKKIQSNPKIIHTTTANRAPKPASSKNESKLINNSVDLTKTVHKKKVGESVDLTKQTRASIARKVKNDPRHREDASKIGGAFKVDYSKPAYSQKTSTASKPAPSKLCGTSRSIILDGKSKSLKVDTKNAPFVQITSSLKTTDKRPTPSTLASAPKKKKTEPMTLKDFDIDDIDDIIELD